MLDAVTRGTASRGAAAVELAVLVPVVGLLLAGLAGGARIGWARAQVEEAAAAGARAASIPASAGSAQAAGRAAVESDLRTVGVHCRSIGVAVDTSAYGTEPGTRGEVVVTVSCDLDLSDAVLAGLPGSVGIAATASEPVDMFRVREP
ncbi:hypothetical protein GCM10009785_09900 [Brooklawnia cerclae]